MINQSGIFVAGLLLVLTASSAIAADYKPTAADIPEYVSDPKEMAHAIVVYHPGADHTLNQMVTFERQLTGRVESQEKGGEMPTVIVQKANTIIMPLVAGVPVKMYLRRFPDRDAYYPIAIFPVSPGAK